MWGKKHLSSLTEQMASIVESDKDAEVAVNLARAGVHSLADKTYPSLVPRSPRPACSTKSRSTASGKNWAGRPGNKARDSSLSVQRTK